MKYHLYDVNHELIKYWNNQNYIDSLRFLSVFLCKKIDYLTGSQSIIEYADQFDKKGNFIVEIKECTISGNNETRDYINASCLNIDTVNFVTSMVKEAKGKGVEILIVAPPTLRESKVDAEKIDEAYQSISEKTCAMYISQAENHLFERKHMADSIWHCNMYGRKENTEQLIQN